MVAYRGRCFQIHRKESSGGQLTRSHRFHHHHLHILSYLFACFAHWQTHPPSRIGRYANIRAFFYQTMADICEENYMGKATDHVEKNISRFSEDMFAYVQVQHSDLKI